MKRYKRTKREKISSAAPSLRLGVLITLLALIVTAATLLMVPAFSVTEVYCEGNINISSEEIIVASRIETGRNILLCNIGRAKREVEKFPVVKDASVRRIFPNKISITITERIPAAYLAMGTDCVAIDTEGIVLDVITSPLSEAIVDESTPKYERESFGETSAKEKDEADAPEKSDNKDTKDAHVPEEDEPLAENESTDKTEDIPTEKPYSVPLLSGIEVKSASVGKHIKVVDDKKFDEVLTIINALDEVNLLSRATYLDTENLSSLRLVVENRLDIYLGGIENISYRTSFLAEVINTKISSYETVIMDYRGDDIYVRPPDDGKDRFIPGETEEDSDTSTDDNDADDDKKEDKDTHTEEANKGNNQNSGSSVSGSMELE